MVFDGIALLPECVMFALFYWIGCLWYFIGFEIIVFHVDVYRLVFF